MKKKAGNRVGEMVKRVRLRAGYGLRETCRLSGVSPATLSKLEAGLLNPTLSTMRSLTSALGIRPQEWFE
jgi:transcriptional regulator with XRE-family HTH domain